MTYLLVADLVVSLLALTLLTAHALHDNDREARAFRLWMELTDRLDDLGRRIDGEGRTRP
jgi:hypothetical protein